MGHRRRHRPSAWATSADERQLAATGCCQHPIRLRGRIDAIDLATGELRPDVRHRHRARRRAAHPVRQPPRDRLPGLLAGVQARRPPARPRRAWPAARASPRRSPRTRACSPPSPPPRSARCTPAACAARPSCPAAPAATPTPAAARTAATSPARPATPTTTPGSAAPLCAGLLRLHRRRAVQRPRRAAVAPVHHLPAPPPRPARRAHPSAAPRRWSGSATSRSPNTRHAASSTSTP